MAVVAVADEAAVMEAIRVVAVAKKITAADEAAVIKAVIKKAATVVKANKALVAKAVGAIIVAVKIIVEAVARGVTRKNFMDSDGNKNILYMSISLPFVRREG